MMDYCLLVVFWSFEKMSTCLASRYVHVIHMRLGYGGEGQKSVKGSKSGRCGSTGRW